MTTVDKKEGFDKSRIAAMVEHLALERRTFRRNEGQKLDANLVFHLYSGPSI